MRRLALAAALLPLTCSGACADGSLQNGFCDEDGDAWLLQLPSARSPAALAAAADGRSAAARAAALANGSTSVSAVPALLSEARANVSGGDIPHGIGGIVDTTHPEPRTAEPTDDQRSPKHAPALLSEARAHVSGGDTPHGIGGIFDKVKSLMPDTVKADLDYAALEGFASLLNSTLQALQLQADGFMERCSDYGDALLQNASAVSDRAVEGLQASVAAHLGPLQQLWLDVSHHMITALPALSRALEFLGQEDAASRLEVVVGQARTSVAEALANATSVIAEVGNTTQEQKELALAQLNASATEGMAAVASFEAQGVETLRGMVLSLVQRSQAPPELESKLTGLLEPIQTCVGTLADGLRTLFSKTLDASELALELPEEPEEGSAVRASVGLLSVAVCVGSRL